MTLKIEISHEIGDVVYLKTDPEQNERIVTGIIIRPKTIVYTLSCGTSDSSHYDIEISTHKKY